MAKTRAALLLASAALTAACSNPGTPAAEAEPRPSPTSTGHAIDLKFAVDLRDGDGSGMSYFNNDAQCEPYARAEGGSPLSFMQFGEEVTLRDSDDTIVGTGKLGPGNVSNLHKRPPLSFTCTWSAPFTKVLESGFYTITVGETKVGTVSLTDLAAARYHPTLPLEKFLPGAQGKTGGDEVGETSEAA